MSSSSVCRSRRVPRARLARSASLLALACLACDRGPLESATTGAMPAIGIPVGPPPGPAQPGPLPTNPYRDNPVALQQGRVLFTRYNCAGCHGDHGGGGMGPSLRDVTWRYGKSDAKVFDSIAEGRGLGMPAWGLKIPEEQVWKLVLYIHSMRTDREPAAPDQTIPAPPMG